LRKNEMDEQKTRGIFENHAVNADSYKAMWYISISIHYRSFYIAKYVIVSTYLKDIILLQNIFVETL
jgi:hypothetical protein